MIKSKEEALEFLKKNNVKLSNHKSVIVTSDYSIYLDSQVSENNSEVFVLKGEDNKTDKKEEVKKSKKVKDGSADNII